ncbi:MAG: hypothetical protein K5872_08185 [Rhizobiaceae bacterium]|nr:hypothetical protein [Rhizobiaceae bacterium]MCV0406192.1 hypothetical protein [Rhizobiaceae bacterium]
MRNFTSPEHSMMVDAEKYEAMRDAYLKVLPDTEPGITAAEAKAAVLPLLPEALFPAGKTAGWWLKGVQLDQEARGTVVREKSKPLRFRRVRA